MKIHIFPIEPIQTRYTAGWYDHIPKLFTEAGFEVNQIAGEISSADPSEGAFLNFNNTNIWKSTQLAKFIQQVNEGLVGDEDHILITDAWNPCITQLKYIKELTNKKWVFHGIWHAGSWDPHDFLGRIDNKTWIRDLEKSMFNCYDHMYFATKFHIDIFADNLFGPWHGPSYKWEKPGYQKKEWIKMHTDSKKIVRTGFPFEYLEDTITAGYHDFDAASHDMKVNAIIFPHRMAPEKQLDIFLDLQKELPQYFWIVCQDMIRTKKQYHEILQYSKISFSASLQETLGIGQVEALFANAIPLSPKRLSYKEMYDDTFLYSSKWTEDWDAYIKHKEKLKALIVDMIENYSTYAKKFDAQKESIKTDFFSANNMIEIFKSYL